MHFTLLSKVSFPENTMYIKEIFLDATSKPHGYLMFDLEQSTPEFLRFRSNIFNEDGPAVAYLPKRAHKYDSSNNFIIN